MHYLCRTLYTPTYTGYGVVVVVVHTTYIMLWVCIHYSAVVGYYGYSVVCIVHDVFLSSPPTTTPLPTLSSRAYGQDMASIMARYTVSYGSSKGPLYGMMGSCIVSFLFLVGI